MYIHATYTINQVHVEYKKGENLKKTPKENPQNTAKQNKQKTRMHIYLKCLMSKIDCDVNTFCFMTIYLCRLLKKRTKDTEKFF